MFALDNRHEDVVRYLVSKNANVKDWIYSVYKNKNESEIYYYSPLKAAITNASIETLKVILDKKPNVNPIIAIDIANPQERTNIFYDNLRPLEYAIKTGDVDKVLLLAKYGADIHPKGRKPLIYAIDIGASEAMIKTLLELSTNK